MQPPLYLDANATTPCSARALAAVVRFLDASRHLWANPASAHALGARALRPALDAARARVAALVGASLEGGDAVVFSSCATEALAAAVRGAVDARGAAPIHFVASATEHVAVLAALRWAERARGARVTLVAPGADGRVAAAAVAAAVCADTALVAVMLANNETGVVNDVAACAAAARAAARAAGAAAAPFILVDASQAAGKMRVDLHALGADALVLAAHKLYAPKGVGATVLARGAPPLPPLLAGGGQEGGARAGTENVAFICAFGEAAEEAGEWLASGGEAAHAALRARLAARLVARLGARRVVIHGPLGAAAAGGGGDGDGDGDSGPLGAVVAGGGDGDSGPLGAAAGDGGGGLESRLRAAPHTLTNTLSIGFAGARASALVRDVGDALAISAGSACHAGAEEPSHVLAAMGVARDAAVGTVRLSLLRAATAADVDAAADLLAAAVERAWGEEGAAGAQCAPCGEPT